MKNRMKRIGSVVANFVLAFLLICSVSVIPINAASMTYGDTSGAATTATPCPMMMTMQGHGEDGSKDVFGSMDDIPCCPVQAVDVAKREAAPTCIAVPVTVETMSDARSSLSDPGVDPQPPRG